MKKTHTSSTITLAAALAAVRAATVPALAEAPDRDRQAESEVPAEIRRSDWQGWNLAQLPDRPWARGRGATIENVAKLARYNFTAEELAEAQALEDEHFEVQELIAKHCNAHAMKAEIVEAEAHEGDPFERFQKIEQLKRKLSAVPTIAHDMKVRNDAVLNRMSPYAEKVVAGCLELIFEAISAAEQFKPIASEFWQVGVDQPDWLIFPLKKLRDGLIEAHALFASRNILGYQSVRYYLAVSGVIEPRVPAEHLC